MMDTTTTTRRLVSLPAEVASGVDERVGKNGFSACAAAAIARQLRFDSLNDIIDRMETKHGSVDDEAVATLATRFSQ